MGRSVVTWKPREEVFEARIPARIAQLHLPHLLNSACEVIVRIINKVNPLNKYVLSVITVLGT